MDEQNHKDFLTGIANSVHELVRNQAKREQFREEIGTFCERSDENNEALKKHLKKVEANPQWRNYADGKPPFKGWIWDGFHKIWRPNMPFDPWAWLFYHYTDTSVPGFGRDEAAEPKNKNERLMCEYVLLGIIYDKRIEPPSCEQLCNMNNDEFAMLFWRKLVSSLVKDNTREAIKSRVNIALGDVKDDLAGKEKPKLWIIGWIVKGIIALTLLLICLHLFGVVTGNFVFAAVLTCLHLLGYLEQFNTIIDKRLWPK